MSDPSPANPLGDRATRVHPGPAGGDLSRLQGDQRRRWAQGERVLVEDYLTAFADVLGDPDALLDLLYHEVLVREEHGDAPELDEYLRRFPQFARQLRDQFEVHSALKPDRWPAEAEPPGIADATTLTEPGVRAVGAVPSIPGYEVIGELGRGGMGVVYLAWQTGVGRLAALKMILAGEYSRPQDLARFRGEVEAVARLEHPNLVKIYEVGDQDSRPYFSMEYVDSGRLADSLRGTPWPPRRSAELAETLARAAQAAHDRGVVHRDLNPNNVLLTADGQPKIVDFGLAKLLIGGAGHTTSGDILGTPSYMAPEQAVGRSKEVGPPADVYALGAILYEMLTGHPPFKAETPLDTLIQVVNDEPVPPRRLQPKVPRDLETVCLKCLNKEPTRRYPGASALADDLRRYLAGEPVRARPVGAVGRAVRWARRRPAVATLLAVCATGAAVAFAAVSWEGRQARLAQGRAERAQKAEETQRFAAEAAGEREAKQRRLYQGLSARLLRDRAMSQCEDGDVGRGLLWLAQSLKLVPDDDLDLRRAIRTNLAGWQGQAHPLLGLLGHEDHVVTAAWSPDGGLILTAADRTIRPWDAATGQPRGQPLRLPRGVSAVAFSPDGATFLTVAGREARLWKTDTVEPAVEQAMDLGKGGQYLSHAFSREGCRLWTATRRGQMTWLQSWRADTGRPLGEEVEIGKGVTRVTFSPDGQSFVTAGESREVCPCLWRTATGKPVRELKEHTHFGIAVAFNPKDGRSFLTGSHDRTCRLWDATTGEPLRPPFRHHGQVRSVAFSPNGRTILAGCYDGFAQFWDVARGTPLGVPMRHPDPVGPVAFSPDGRFALTVSRDQVRLWDAATNEPEPLGAPLPHQQEVLSASFAPDGRAVLTRGRDSTVRIWQTAPARPGRRLEHNGWVMAAAFRPPDGESLLTGLGASEGKVLSWDMASDRKPDVAFDRLGPILSLAYRPDGRMFAVGTQGRQVWFWDTAKGCPARGEPLELDDRVWAVAFSPDGQTLLTGTGRRRAEFWDVATGQRRPEPLEHGKAVYAVAYSPDGRAILTGSGDMTARLWDAASHKPLGVTLVHQGTVFAVAFRPPDGQVLLTGSDDRTARLWDTASGRPLGAPFQHPSRILAVAFSPDGRTFATGCGDGMARLWDVATGYPIGCPLPHRGPVRAVAFGPRPRDPVADGGCWTLVTGSEEPTPRVWEVPAPLTGSPDRIVLSLQVANGLILDAQGVAESLPPATWWRLCRELLAMCGPPPLRPGHGPAIPGSR